MPRELPHWLERGRIEFQDKYDLEGNSEAESTRERRPGSSILRRKLAVSLR